MKTGGPEFDAVVVGAGPAGSGAALVMARAGMKVLLVERGAFPGAKNVSGAAFYGGAILAEVIPRFWEHAPLERVVTRRTLALMSPDAAVALDFRAARYGAPPYNAFTVMRPRFDRWLADQAEQAGAVLLPATVVDDLLYDGEQVVGVRVRRADGEVRAQVVVACDGVNSLLARKAGLREELDPAQIALGVKEVLGLERRAIEERFQLEGEQGAVGEYIGDITADVHGGAFLYTNRDTLAAGVIVQLSSLVERRQRPDELLERFKAHPHVAPLLRGARPREYSAHLIPEAGWAMLPRISRGGMLLAGDAAAFCFAAGLFLEGMNYALQSGLAAGETAALAWKEKDFSPASLARYRDALRRRHVLTDFKRFRHAPEFVGEERLQNVYPGLVARGAEELFRVDGQGKKKALAIARRLLKESNVSMFQVMRDLFKAGRSFGW